MDESLLTQPHVYFRGQPISKAWLFGARSRGDNREDSDFDILVSFDNNVGLFKFSSIASDLEEILKRGVDLVSETALFPWVRDSVNHEKQLLYERKA